MIGTRSKINYINDARKDMLIAALLQVYMKLFHEEFNREFGCILPCFGGLKISDEEGHTLCLNTSVYNSTRMYEVDSQSLSFIVFCPCSDFIQLGISYEDPLQGFRHLLRCP